MAKLSNWVAYKKNNSILFLSFVFIILSFSIYSLYFDILIPGIPSGSYRKNVGDYFIFPVFFLISAQILSNSGIIHTVIKAVAPEKKDFLKAFFVSSVLVFLFSVLYVVFPFYGPFLYIVRSIGSFDVPTYLFLALWTSFSIFLTNHLMRKMYSLGKSLAWKKTLLITAFLFAMTMSMAS